MPTFFRPGLAIALLGVVLATASTAAQQTPNDEHRWMVYAIDFATGKTVWEREVHRAVPAQSRHLKNSYASETPVTDGERVYVSFGNVGLFAFRLDGAPIWQHKWPPRATRNGWGTAASPVLHQGRLYIVNDNEDDSHLMALDAATGRELWRAHAARRPDVAGPCDSTPSCGISACPPKIPEPRPRPARGVPERTFR